MEEINKFLTKAIGECWHDGNASHPCTRCGLTMSMSTGYHNITFLTWEGFGKLWEWANRQVWFGEFHYWYTGKHTLDLEELSAFTGQLINPERFAKAVVKFLQEK